MSPPTIFDVARRAGVSKSTVSKVLTQTPHVRLETRQRVEAAIADLNYHPSVTARRFQSRRSHLIGLGLPEIGYQPLPLFYAALMSGVGVVTAECGYNLVWLLANDRATEHHDTYAKAYLRREVDGLLLTAIPLGDPRIAALRRTECPFVIVGRYDNPDVYTVDVDNVAVGYLATRHLLNLGHTRIGLLKGHRDQPFSHDRYTGYLQALRESGVAIDDPLVQWPARNDVSGYAATLQMLDAFAPTAFIATDMGLQPGCLRALHDRHRRVPTECSVVGVADVMPDTAEPTISVVVQPTFDLAGMAADLLLRLIAGTRPEHKRYVLSPVFVDGLSTVPPVADRAPR